MRENNIVTVPGQKIVRVKREPKGRVYSYVNNDAESQAARDLKAGAFKLWCYLRRNRDGYVLGLSQLDCEESFGIGEKQYRGAVKELIEKDYLVLDRGNVYVFYEKKKD